MPGNQTLTQQTGPLGPGEERELTYTFTYPKPGNFRSIADADAFSQVKETNEANNEKILNVTVEPALIGLYFTGADRLLAGEPGHRAKRRRRKSDRELRSARHGSSLPSSSQPRKAASSRHRSSKASTSSKKRHSRSR